MVETKAFFPSREEAERFAQQFDGQRYHIAIQPQPRAGREVYQVHVRHAEMPSPPPAADLLRLTHTFGPRPPGGEDAALAERLGRTMGEGMARERCAARVERREGVAVLGELLERSGLGTLAVVSLTPLVLRVRPPLGRGAHDPGRRCAHVAGFLAGALGQVLGAAPAVREVDCVGLGGPECTFTLDL